jgi:hypothetical protein
VRKRIERPISRNACSWADGSASEASAIFG